MFNYKDLTYLRVATLAYIEKLSLIEEDDLAENGDHFAEVQDDLQYFSRLRDEIEREIVALRTSPKTQKANLSIVASKE